MEWARKKPRPQKAGTLRLGVAPPALAIPTFLGFPALPDRSNFCRASWRLPESVRIRLISLRRQGTKFARTDCGELGGEETHPLLRKGWGARLCPYEDQSNGARLKAAATKSNTNCGRKSPALRERGSGTRLQNQNNSKRAGGTPALQRRRR